MKNRTKFMYVSEITKTIKDEFAYTHGKHETVRKMILIDMGEGNWKLETYYH